MSLPSLSPSRAAEFKRCPQRFRYRHIDKLEEPKHPAAATGNLVHAVLEVLFSCHPTDRTEERALELLEQMYANRQDTEWENLDDEAVERSRKFVHNYFELEDPRTVTPRALELRVELDIGGLLARGIIDRVDEPDGALVDYKTGRPPGVNYEMQAFFGLRFYALVVWRLTGVAPPKVTLLYLDSGEQISINPNEQTLAAFERQLLAIRDAIARANSKNDFRPRPGAICKSCNFTDICPAWEGVVPPWKAN